MSGAHPMGGGAAGLQPPKLKFKKSRLCRHDDIKRFTRFTLQPKSATEIDIRILKNKMNILGCLRWN
jgi:hypothetical protein